MHQNEEFLIDLDFGEILEHRIINKSISFYMYKKVFRDCLSLFHLF